MGSRSRAEVDSMPSLSPERHRGALLLGKLRDVTVLVREFCILQRLHIQDVANKNEIVSGIVGKQDK